MTDERRIPEERISDTSAIEPILAAALSAGASDVHLQASARPMFRIHTHLSPSDLPTLTGQQTIDMIRHVMTEAQWAALQSARDCDFALQIANLGRFRCNVHYQRGRIAAAIRVLGAAPLPMESLHLPETIEKLCDIRNGLVLVTGPAGSGKSTTLLAMLQRINKSQTGHIITLEDPIEHTLRGEKCLIEQREVGADVPSFASGLRHALRQDPDTLFVGEMRDLETTSAALTAAETGHRVYSTLHTAGAAQTVERIVDMYSPSEQNRARTMLAGSLRAVISQMLLRRIDEPGMIPAVEILIATPAVKTCIRENRLVEIGNLIETGRNAGMQTLEASLQQLVKAGCVSLADAIANAAKPERLTGK